MATKKAVLKTKKTRKTILPGAINKKLRDDHIPIKPGKRTVFDKLKLDEIPGVGKEANKIVDHNLKGLGGYDIKNELVMVPLSIKNVADIHVQVRLFDQSFTDKDIRISTTNANISYQEILQHIRHHDVLINEICIEIVSGKEVVTSQLFGEAMTKNIKGEVDAKQVYFQKDPYQFQNGFAVKKGIDFPLTGLSCLHFMLPANSSVVMSFYGQSQNYNLPNCDDLDLQSKVDDVHRRCKMLSAIFFENKLKGINTGMPSREALIQAGITKDDLRYFGYSDAVVQGFGMIE